MVISNFQGRLGNNLIQFFAAYFFSKKHNLSFYINDCDTFLNNGNEELYNLILSYQSSYKLNEKEIIIVNDYNFFDYYNLDILPDMNYSFVGYFQFKNFFSPLRNEIKNILNIKYDEEDKNKVFIHYRLGDIKNSNLMLPLEYYTDAMELLGNPEGYISSDTIEHENCQALIKKYNLTVIQKRPWETILFAKNFDNIILSEGTFSVMIGLLSNAKNIITNMRDTEWGLGDLCGGLDDYIKLYYNYNPYPNVIKYKKPKT